MTKFFATLIDECGDPFETEIEAKSIDEAWDQLSEDYPESRVEEVTTNSLRERAFERMSSISDYDLDLY